MASLNIYEDILAKWHEVLTDDLRIGGNNIQVIYSRRIPEEIEINLMPCVMYFLEPNWSDDAYGSGSYSPQSRRVNIRMGFLLSMISDEPGKLDKALFKVGTDLLDIVRENQLWGAGSAHRAVNESLLAKSIVIKRDITWDFDAVRVEDGRMIGTQIISFTMEQFANFN